MELRLLRYFLTVAREESISGAADALHLTQPTLSRQMMELEKSLGVTLFTRGSRRIALTDEGMLLRKRADEIVALADKTEAAFRSIDQMVGGEVFIGGGETEAMRIVARVTREIHANHPDIRFHLYSGNGEDVTERLDKGLLDFGVLIEPINISKYEAIRLPVKDTWGILLRKDDPLAERDAICPEDLWEAPLITSRQAMRGKEFAAWLQKDHDRLNIVATYNLLYNATLLVEEGLGYAVCLDRLVNTTGTSKLCFRPLSPGLEAGLHLVWKRYQVFSKASQLFLERIRMQVR